MGDAKVTDGWLLLVPAQRSKRGAALLDQEFPSERGIAVEFEFAAWGGTAYEGKVGDGIAFFLIDGAQTLEKPGAWGGALGYACAINTKEPGIKGGHLGVGIDQFGNFSSSDHAGHGGPGQCPNHVVLRGSGDGVEGYYFLTGVSLPSLVMSQEQPTRVQLAVIDQKVTVSIGEGSLTKVLDYDLRNAKNQAALPKTLKLGLTASTGMATSNYALRDLHITTELADLAVAIHGPESVQAGFKATYEVVVCNYGPNEAPDAEMTVKPPPELIDVSYEIEGAPGAGNQVKLALPKGGQKTIKFTGTVPAKTPSQTITAQASVTSASMSDP